MPLCAPCCRARTFTEPVTAFICDKVPEHTRKTSRMDTLLEDIKKLPLFAVMDVSEWLSNKLDSLTQEEVGGAGLAVLQVGCHHDSRQGGRESGKELSTAAQQWDFGVP